VNSNSEIHTSRATWAITLGDLLATVRQPTLELIAAPKGLDLAVGGLVIYDSHELLPTGLGCVLFLVGVSPRDAEVDVILERAAELGYVAAVLKSRGASLDSLTELAQNAGIAVVAVSQDISWREIDSLVVAALGSGGISAKPGASAGVSVLFALVNSIASTVGGSVVVEDLEQRILAHSSVPGQRIDASRQTSILNRRVPDLPWHREQYLKILKSPVPVRFPSTMDELPRVAVAIRSGGIPLGTLWAIEGAEGLSSDMEHTLVDGAEIAAVHVLKQATLDEADHHIRSDALASVLNGSLPITEAARRWNFTAESEVSLISFAPSGPPPGSAHFLAQMAVALRRHLAALRPDAVSTATAQPLYVLVPGSSDSALLLARRTIQALDQGVGIRVRAAVSRTTQDLSALTSLANEVDEILGVEAFRDASHVLTFQEVRCSLLLQKAVQLLRDDPRLKEPLLKDLAEQDQDSKSHFIETLTVWLDAFGSWSKAGRNLGLHQNTVRYRIARIEENFGLNLQNPEVRLAVWLELHAVTAKLEVTGD